MSSNTKKGCRALPFIASFFLIIAILITAVEICATDEGWVFAEYEKLGINDYSGMSDADMTKAYMTMVNFMTSESDSLELTVTCFGEQVEMYNESETSHLQDVRNLYTGVMWVRASCICIAIACIAIFLIMEKLNRLQRVSKGFLIALAVIAGIFVILLLWAIIDFRSFWYMFHVLLLDVESSTFDPQFSRMIRICPEELFFDICVRIVTLGFGCCLLIGLAAAVYLIIKKRAKKHELL